MEDGKRERKGRKTERKSCECVVLMLVIPAEREEGGRVKIIDYMVSPRLAWAP